MVKAVTASVLRKRLGIKKLKAKITISDFEKAAIVNLRKRDRRRVTPRVLVHV
jgi:hypothetical protein